MKPKRSVLFKMFLFVVLPVAVVFCVTAAIVLTTVKQTVTQLTNNQVTTDSKAASYQIEAYFAQYTEVATQMAANSQYEDIFLKTGPGTVLTSTEEYHNVKRSMDSVKQSDPDNIVISWIADVDSSQYTQSDGYLSGADWKITERSWYKELLEKQTVILTEPYQDAHTNEWTVSVVAPVYQKGTKNLIGVTAIDFSIKNLQSMVSGYKLGNTGFYMLATDDGKFIYHPDKEMNDKNVSESNMSKNLVTAIQNKTAGAITYTAMNQTNYGYVSPIGATGWTVTTGLPEKEFNEKYNAVQMSVYIIFGIALLILMTLIVLVSKGIILPLKKLTVAAGKIADGDLDVDLHITSKDETGQVAQAFSRTVDRLREYILYIQEVSSVLDQIAVGNLAFELQCDYVGEFSKIKDSLENIKTTLVKTFSGIYESAEQVASGSGQVADGSQALAQGAAEQASSIEELSASITEIAGQVNLTASNAANASQLAEQTSVEIQRGNESMQKLVAAMEDMSQSSGEIGKIIKTIQDIAFQTNILALNAAVEAARAGSAGKGFAVVADEVRNLASKSAEAAANTTTLIENSIYSVNNGTKIVQETAQSLSLVIDSAQKTTQLIDEISKASKDQALSIDQITTGVDQISAVVQTNSATSEESAASSEELNGQAQMLKMLVERFKTSSLEEN
ncbi:methyl-accepting chemotaxis protein [Caproiciproducens faecalis]|uniref:Methyl-accepting chemotaxis protein n=1 Tax=Caproiciproducens faecalis TaxID=2820301 RepID=A0ABS7DJI1_9FIRM|nr:methyl-accepting chemotaxis protein [Caproiciproducens faecalis]MBW7571453.1 methyl-accepting chemotaxis protein [Caproiciproducens faecalis]